MHIVGARPQFIKASVVCRKMKEFGVSQSMVHTGQHAASKLKIPLAHVEAGWNVLARADKKRIVKAIDSLWSKTDMKPWESFYGDGSASLHICEIVMNFINETEGR
jgi:UDP-N-acetylglucosamine 2-epimerase